MIGALADEGDGMTTTIERGTESEARRERGLSTLPKALIGIALFYFGIVPVFWYLEVHAGVSHSVASNTMTVLHILCFAGALALPWLPLSVSEGERGRRSWTRW